MGLATDKYQAPTNRLKLYVRDVVESEALSTVSLGFFFIELKFCKSDFYSLNSLKKCKVATYNFGSVLFAYSYDPLTIYITLPHCLIKKKNEIIDKIFNTECSLYLECNERPVFFSSEQYQTD